MTQVNVTTEGKTVVVDGSTAMGQINVSTDGKTVVVEDIATNTVSITTTGPQGPGIGNFEFNGDAKEDGSIVYFNLGNNRYQADADVTTSEFFSKTEAIAATNVLCGPIDGNDAAPSFRTLKATDIPPVTHEKISDFDSAAFTKDAVQNAGTVLCGPASGDALAPTFRDLEASDIPPLSHDKINDFDVEVRKSTLAQMAAPAGEVSFNDQKIVDLADPQAATDAANKKYVDAVKVGLDFKESCLLATTEEITLSGVQAVDGFNAPDDARVLVKNQNDKTKNGIYICDTSGAWGRAPDFNASTDPKPSGGAFVFIEKGTVNANGGFVCTTIGEITIDSTNVEFTQFSGAGAFTAGEGLAQSGTEFSVDRFSEGGIVVDTNGLKLDLTENNIVGSLPLAKGGTGATSQQTALTAIGAQALNANLTTLSGVGVAATELAALSATEVQVIDGTTAATSTTLATGHKMCVNAGGNMRQVEFSDLVAFLEDGATSTFNIDGGTYGS